MQGEEGVDAGGVSREWYSVMAQEIFNPNLALFVQVRRPRPRLCVSCACTCVCLMRVHISLACTRTCEIEKHTLVSEGCVYAGGRVLHSTCAHAGTLQGAGAERSGGGARAAPGSAGFPPFCTPLF